MSEHNSPAKQQERQLVEVRERLDALEEAHNGLVELVSVQREMLQKLVAMAELQQQFMRAVKEIIYQ